MTRGAPGARQIGIFTPEGSHMVPWCNGSYVSQEVTVHPLPTRCRRYCAAEMVVMIWSMASRSTVKSPIHDDTGVPGSFEFTCTASS